MGLVAPCERESFNFTIKESVFPLFEGVFFVLGNGAAGVAGEAEDEVAGFIHAFDHHEIPAGTERATEGLLGHI